MNFNIRMGIPEMQELWLDLQEKYHSVYRRKTFPKSKQEENKGGSYQQGQISRLHLLQI